MGVLEIVTLAIFVFYSRIRFEDTLAGMNTLQESENKIPFIRELCKHKTEAEIQEAEENFRRYLRLVKRICERLELEEQAKSEVDKPA